MTDPTPPRNPASDKVIDLSVEVVGTPEQVWAAIATGPGVSSWYVPTTVDERGGGETTSRFGEGDEMLIRGRVVAWEPPNRVLFDGGPDVQGGLAFEWLVEGRADGTCIVRLVNSGFGSGAPWDDQYDAMAEGWRLFLTNLQLHLERFPGQSGIAMLPMASWAGPRETTWQSLTDALGIPAAPAVGSRIAAHGGDVPPLAGTVAHAESWFLSVVLDEPAPGTAIIAVEGHGDGIGVSIWQYLYGPDAAAIVARDQPRWTRWLAERSLTPPEGS
jgi:uncharacterized protein YndB with AHSA1/START domain